MDKDKDMETDDEEDVFFNANAEDNKQIFLSEFAASRRLFNTALRNANSELLVKDVQPNQLESFRNTRKVLSKWFITGAHLQNKLKGETQTNKYLKVDFDYSIAITDQDLKEKCTNKLINTRKQLENSLTASVLQKAILLNQEVKSLWENTHRNIFLKAYRVVVKANNKILNYSDNYHPNRPDDKQHKLQNKKNQHQYSMKNHNSKDQEHQEDRDLYRKHNWNKPHTHPNKHRNQHKQYREEFSSSSDEDDYPPPRRQNHDYRRYKRQAFSNYDEDDEPYPPRKGDRTYYGRPSRSYYY
jgi:hypothetical protein